MISKIPFRVSIWWHHILTPVLGCIFLSIDHPLGSDTICLLALFILTFVGTASFGYFINDWCDVNTDKIAGKVNYTENLTKQRKQVISGVLFLIALIPWFFIDSNSTNLVPFTLWFFEIILLLAYSIQPIRLKNKGLLGIMADALYAHVIPTLIAITLFSTKVTLSVQDWLFILSVLMLKGLRNIIIHQIHDKNSDSKANLNTFVIIFGIKNSIKLLNLLIIPFEIILHILIVIIYPGETNIWFLSFTFFLFWNILSKGIFIIKRNFSYNEFWYLLNDFHEGWFLYISLFLLIQSNNLSFMYLLLILFIFYKPIPKLLSQRNAIQGVFVLAIKEVLNKLNLIPTK